MFDSINCFRKCAGYYFIDTDIDADAEDAKEKIVTNKTDTVKCNNKRKNFTTRERLKSDRKTKGNFHFRGGNFLSVLIVEMGREWYNIKAYYI